MKPILFFDAEINPENGQILDIGAVDADGRQFHAASVGEFTAFVKEYGFIGGHNILSFDLKYLEAAIPQNVSAQYVDTLCLSPLLFPAKPYHRLLKDDKLQTDSLSNPLDDAVKSFELFCDEVTAFEALDDTLKQIWYLLLHQLPEFSGFFAYLEYTADNDAVKLIAEYFDGKICANAPLPFMVMNHPRELAYCLALISADDRHSITPPWVQINYPLVDNYMRVLRNHPCEKGCPYCAQKLNVKSKLAEIFGYPSFRTYEGEPLQERAADAAVHNKSLLAIFPTGGGKSITFQLPALMAGENAKGLTVIISPLQSLMKDQVDNLAERGITDAVTINGLLNAVERAEAIERVEYPIVQNIISNRAQGKTICVLTSTNDEALRVNGLLRQMQIPSRLIQSSDGFSLYDLAELRMFLKYTGKENHPIISDEQWEKAIADLKDKYESSQCLDLVLSLLERFASVNEKKYRSDLESFIRESQFADFCFPNDSEVVVSIIHKAKGHEFDCVYLMLNRVDLSNNEKRRVLYVGMTRAKSELYLHYNNHAFDSFSDDIIDDPEMYPEPEQITLQLTHKDVVLNYFMPRKKLVFALHSGTTLTLHSQILIRGMRFRRKTGKSGVSVYF